MPLQQAHSATPQAAHATAPIAADTVAMHADSAHRDSAAAYYAPRYLNGFPADSAQSCDTVLQPIATLPVMEVPAGRNAQPLGTSPLHDAGSMALFLLAIFLVIINYHSGYKYFENLWTNMFSVRKRENMFNDSTVNETQTLSSLIANTAINEGLLAYMALASQAGPLWQPMHAHVFRYVGALCGLMLVFYLLQLGLYHVLGYIFSDKDSTHIWVAGYKASQSLLGMLLIPVTAIALALPSVLLPALAVAAGFYVLARVVFIAKGFRIFFNDFQSFLYFILYLCSVEIVPVILLAVSAVQLCSILQS